MTVLHSRNGLRGKALLVEYTKHATFPGHISLDFGRPGRGKVFEAGIRQALYDTPGRRFSGQLPGLWPDFTESALGLEYRGIYVM